MNKDTLVGIVGSALLVAAMVVVFAYERANAAEVRDNGEGLTPSIGQASLTGTVNVGSSDTKTSDITAVGATNVTFMLTWTASQGTDTLRLAVTPPAGSDITARTSQAEDDGSITVTVPVPADYAAQGNWTLKVDFVSAEPDTLPGGVTPPVGGMTDSSVSYTISVAFD